MEHRLGVDRHTQGWFVLCKCLKHSSKQSTQQRHSLGGTFPGWDSQEGAGSRERMLQLHSEVPDVHPNPKPQTFLFLCCFSPSQDFEK